MSTQNFSTKECTRCKLVKPLEVFYKDNRVLNGHGTRCNSCVKIYADAWRHTRDGVIAAIYNGQKKNSKDRGHLPPEYTVAELKVWIYKQVQFDCLYLNWINSGYSRWKKPSVDRVDDYKPYTFDNLLRICTWQDNLDRSHSDRKNGENNKHNKAVIQLTREGIIINEYHSQQQASRETGVGQSHIGGCCNNKERTAGGFVWAFA